MCTQSINKALYKNVLVNEWNEWRAITQCSKSCGGGIRKRTRSYYSSPCLPGGKGCPGITIEEQTCNNYWCRKYFFLFSRTRFQCKC